MIHSGADSDDDASVGSFEQVSDDEDIDYSA